MKVVLRLGWRLARSGRRDHGWRQAAMLVSTLVTGVLVLAGCSLVLMAIRENAREADRAPVRAVQPAATDLLAITQYDVWDGRQFPAIWIEPRDRNAATALPRGMERLPDSGTAVVSPALDEAARAHPLLAERYPRRVVLGADGYVAGDELFAWIRPDSTQRFDPLRADAIAAFGSSSHNSGAALGLSEDTVILPLVVGVVALLLIPALGLLIAGAVTSAPVRDHRIEVLHRLGLRQRTLRGLVAVETTVLALPGLVLAATAWRIVAARLTAVPLVGRHVQRGDLALPIWASIAVAAVVLMLTGAVAVVGAWSPGRSRTPRPVVTARRMPLVRILPLLAGLIVAAFASLGSGRSAALQLLAGTALCVVSIPLAAPYALKRAGQLIARMRPSVPVLLAARRLARDPVGSARPVLALAAFLVVAPATMAFVAVVGADDEPRSDADLEAVAVSSSAPGESWRNFERRLAGVGTVVPVSQRDRLRIFAPCSRLAGSMPGVRCAANGGLTAGGLEALAEVIGVPSELISLDASERRPADTDDALVIAPRRSELAQQVRTAAMRSFVAPNVSTSEEGRRDPLVSWIIGGLVTAALIAATALLVSALDGFVSNRRPHGQLLAVGLAPRTITRLERTSFGVAFGVITGTGLAIGTLIAWLFVRMQPDAAFPGPAIGALGAATVAVGGLGSLLVSSAAGRAAGSDERQLGDPAASARAATS